MDRYLPYDDENGNWINAKAEELYRRLLDVDPDTLGMPAHCLTYYKVSHSSRLFFSIQTSAHLLYHSIRLSGDAITEVKIMDYGAGVGTLYLLAKLIGCNTVVYNDHLEEWKTSAKLVAEAVGIRIDHYVVGDIRDCLNALEKLNIRCNIIASRNVVEHIYKLSDFYGAVFEMQPQAIVYSSTTANRHNPAAVLKHYLWHNKWEKVYRGKRAKLIKQNLPDAPDAEISKLAYKTQGLALGDLQQAVSNFRTEKVFPDPTPFGSNTCDPDSGVWAENLLSEQVYKTAINENHYKVVFKPGFWDTHYTGALKNRLSTLLNRIIRSNERIGMKIAPFIYVIAIPKSRMKV